MRWFSSKGEFAFLSVGGTASGVIAIGGMATGVVAIGGVISIGVVSIGMNAVGSVVALGMNTAAPISISLINGLGVFTLAGVNGWGAWTFAGVNAIGAVGRGGVNSGHSVLPAVVVILALLCASWVVRGRREPRGERGVVRLRAFLRSTAMGEQRVRARLREARAGAIELADGDEALTVNDVDAPALADALAIARGEEEARGVIALLSRAEETAAADDPGDYRARPRAITRAVVRCLEIARAAPPGSWLPKDAEEVRWVLSWSARVAAAASVAALVWLLR